MTKIFAVNAGSSSLKSQLIEMPSEEVLAQVLVERVGMEDSILTIKYPATVEEKEKPESGLSLSKDGSQKKYEETLDISDHKEAVKLMLERLASLGIIENFEEVTGVGHRVVAGGEWFNYSVIIDDEVLSKIERLGEYAPLHNPVEAMGIRAFIDTIPHATQVAVFDTAYHQTMPAKNYLYSLPYEWYTRYGARKYGAHGTSHRYVACRLAEMLGKPVTELNLITAHLGAGASITAIKNGKSYDTSMGFTPLAGLTMATRSGDVDPSLLYYLQEKADLSNEEMLNILNRKSGMLGISSISSDMRDLERVQDTNPHAKLALEMFRDRVIRYIGQYFAELGHVDAIIFTAGIGENDPVSRSEILNAFKYVGIEVDEEANNVRGVEREITTPASKIKAYIIPTNEELMIARDVYKLKNQAD